MFFSIDYTTSSDENICIVDVYIWSSEGCLETLSIRDKEQTQTFESQMLGKNCCCFFHS